MCFEAETFLSEFAEIQKTVNIDLSPLPKGCNFFGISGKNFNFFSHQAIFSRFSSLPLLEWHWNKLLSASGTLEVLLTEELVRAQ